jgi:hypothetical protein
LKSSAKSCAESSERPSMKSWVGGRPEMERTRQARWILANIFRSRSTPAPGSVRCACREDWPAEEMTWRAGRFLPARAEAQAAGRHRRSARGGTRGSSVRLAHRLRSAAIRRGCLAAPFVDWPNGSVGPAQTLRAMFATLLQGIPAAAGGRACRVLRFFALPRFRLKARRQASTRNFHGNGTRVAVPASENRVCCEGSRGRGKPRR